MIASLWPFALMLLLCFTPCLLILQLQVIKSETWDLIEAMKERNLQKLAKKYKEEEESGSIISPTKQFL